MIYVGKLQTQICRISPNAQNESILITGISGSGKTCRMLEMECDSARSGDTVIVLDTSDTHTPNQIFSPIESEFNRLANRISALRDGFNIPFCRPIQTAKMQAKASSKFFIINSATNAIALPMKLGIKQTSVLRKSIHFTIEHLHLFNDELQAIGFALQQEGPKGEEVYDRLWNLFNCGVLRNSTKMIQAGRINILEFDGLDVVTKNQLAEIILTHLLRVARNGKETYVVFLDECQNFCLKPDSAIFKLLREGRKFHINLVLSTQSLSVFNKEAVSMLNQASTKLYFRPALDNVCRTAKQLSPEDRKIWEGRLLKLRTGECIAHGFLCVGRTELHRPILLR